MTEPKPEFWTEPHALAFQHPQVAASYQYRPLYPPETFEILSGLILDSPRRVLDLGCGTGGLSRYLVEIADHVDAIDISAAMIEQGKHLPNGDSPKLTWMLGHAEEVTADTPYALITAGDSLHWMDWEILLPHLRTQLSAHGSLAICNINTVSQPWHATEEELFREFSTMPTFQAIDLVAELERRDLFTVRGKHKTKPVLLTQSIDDYIESFHARSSLAHGRMEPGQSAAFDNAMRELLARNQVSQIVTQVFSILTWGLPHARGAQ